MDGLSSWFRSPPSHRQREWWYVLAGLVWIGAFGLRNDAPDIRLMFLLGGVAFVIKGLAEFLPNALQSVVTFLRFLSVVILFAALYVAVSGLL